jgi:hypothetical protein
MNIVRITSYFLLLYLICLAEVTAQQTIEMTVKVTSNNNAPVVESLVTLNINNTTKTARTGQDGMVRFYDLSAGHYVLKAEAVGYSFTEQNGNISNSATVNIIGTAIGMTYSGTVKNNISKPITTAKLKLNGKSVNIATDGSFSTPLYPGQENIVEINDVDFIFTNPVFKFKSIGNRTEQFIGFPR